MTSDLLADIPVFQISGSRQLCTGEPLLLTVNYEENSSYEWLNPFGHLIGDSSVLNFPNPVEGIYRLKIHYQDTIISLESGINISAQIEAGNLSGSREICKNEGETGILLLENYTGEIIRWESSLSGEAPWQTIFHHDDTLQWTDLPVTTFFRAVVSNHICDEVYSNAVKLSVRDQAQAGYLIGPETVCSGQTGKKLRLVANTAQIRYWQKRTFNSAWQTLYDENGQEFRESYCPLNDLNQSTYFRAASGHESCEEVFTAPYYLEIENYPEIDFEVYPVCVGEISRFSAPDAARYFWDFGDGNSSVLQHPSHLFDTAGLHEITLTVIAESGCEYKVKKTVRVYAKPEPSFDTEPLCFSTTVHFNNTSLESENDSFLFYRWEFGDGQTDTSWAASELVSHHFEKSGYYQVKLEAENAWGCKSEVIKEIAVLPLDTAHFNAQIACAGDTSVFISQTLTNDNARFLWDFGSGQLEEGSVVNHVYGSPGSFQVKLKIVREFCTDSAIMQVSVLPGSKAGILRGDTTVCASYNRGKVQLSDFTGEVQYWEVRTDPNGGWMRIDHQSAIHTFEDLDKDIWFRVISGNERCGFEVSNTVKITVVPAPFGGRVEGNREICKGDTPSPLILSGFSGEIAHWLFSEDDGQNWAVIECQDSVLHVENLEQTTLYKVEIVNDLCTSTYSSIAKISVLNLPDVDFFAAPVCLGEATHFQNLTAGLDEEGISYEWIFEEGYSSVNSEPVHHFQNAGKYDVRLTVENSSGCAATISRSVEVYENPISDFILSDVCLGEESYFENHSSHSDSQLNYVWDLGNGETLRAENPRMIYESAGIYTVTLTVSSPQGCNATSTQSLTVFPKPALRVLADSTVIQEGNSTFLHAMGGIYYRWEPSEYLNDPDIANPLATPEKTTLFSVTTIDENGCSQTDDLLVEVTEKPADEIRVLASRVLTPDQNGKNDYWVIQNIESYPNSQVTVFNRWGEVVFEQTGYRNDWQGRRGADLLPDGVYFFRIAFVHTSSIYTGSLTILRNKP